MTAEVACVTAEVVVVVTVFGDLVVATVVDL